MLSEVLAPSTARHGGSMRLRGRSYLAFALAPEPPIAEWLAELDVWLRGSPGFFAGRPAVLDLAAVTLTSSAMAHLVSELGERGIRIMGLEGVAAEKVGPGLPPLLTAGRPTPGGTTEPAPDEVQVAKAPDSAPRSMVIDTNVRSGQSVFFPDGDVVVLGSVSSGAEVIAGGSVHVYGTLRGRVMAGTSGNSGARIFCRRIEAELVAIDGYYRTAVSLDPQQSDRPVQAWLAGESLIISAME
jgi:septum site-determining protein MinC